MGLVGSLRRHGCGCHCAQRFPGVARAGARRRRRLLSTVAGSSRAPRWSAGLCRRHSPSPLWSPFLLFCQTQLFQVRWISPLSADTFLEILQEQYFEESVPFAVLAGLVMAAAVVAAVIRRRQMNPSGSDHRRLVLIMLTWITFPTAALVLYSAVKHPVYYPRYLSFTSPALALLLGLCVVTVGRTRDRITAILVLFATAALPNYLVQRGPYAKEQMDYSQSPTLSKPTPHPATAWCWTTPLQRGRRGRSDPPTAARPAAFQKAARLRSGPDGHPARPAVGQSHSDLVLGRQDAGLRRAVDGFRTRSDPARTPASDVPYPRSPASAVDGLPGSQPVRLPCGGTLAVQLRPGHQVDTVRSPSRHGERSPSRHGERSVRQFSTHVRI